MTSTDLTWAPGDLASWGSGNTTVTIEVTSADTSHISYRHTDGYMDAVHASHWHPLAHYTDKWRPATPAETTAFRAAARPAPANY